MKRQPTILIVADESAMSQTLGTLLATDDYHLAFAQSGTEAFEKAPFPFVVTHSFMLKLMGMGGPPTFDELQSETMTAI